MTAADTIAAPLGPMLDHDGDDLATTMLATTPDDARLLITHALSDTLRLGGYVAGAAATVVAHQAVAGLLQLEPALVARVLVGEGHPTPHPLRGSFGELSRTGNSSPLRAAVATGSLRCVIDGGPEMTPVEAAPPGRRAHSSGSPGVMETHTLGPADCTPGADDAPADGASWPSLRPELDEPARHVFAAAEGVSRQEARRSLQGAIYRVGDAIAAEGSARHPGAMLAAQTAIHELARMDPAEVVTVISAARAQVGMPTLLSLDEQPIDRDDATGSRSGAAAEPTLQAFAHLAAGYLGRADWSVMQAFAAGCMRDGFALPMERRLHLPTTANGRRLLLRDHFLRQALRHLPTPPNATPWSMARHLAAFWRDFLGSARRQEYIRDGVPDFAAPSSVAIHHATRYEPDAPLHAEHLGRILKHELAKKCVA